MRSEVLESLISQGSLVGIVCSKSCDVEKNLESLVRALCGDAPFLFVEYSRKNGTGRAFLQELQRQKDSGIRYVFVRFSDNFDRETASVLASMRMTLVLSDEELESDLLSELEAVAPFSPGFLWWVAPKPSRKRFPKLVKSIGKNCLSGWTSSKRLSLDSEEAARIFLELLRARILRENALVGWPLFFRKFFVPLGVLVAAIPFLLPSGIGSGPSLSRNIKAEMAFYSEAPYFDYTFDGSEPFERIARYAVGRFAALVTTEKTLGDYVGETLEKNGFPENSWENGRQHIPPQGTTIRFSIPENLKNPDYDSIAPAWKFFTRIIGDSIAYVTELYREKATAQGRKQRKGVDIQGRTRRNGHRHRRRKAGHSLYALRSIAVSGRTERHAGRSRRDRRHHGTHDRTACTHGDRAYRPAWKQAIGKRALPGSEPPHLVLFR